MNRDDWQRVRRVFEDLLKLPGDDRVPALDEALHTKLGSDQRLQAEVLRLLEAEDDTEHFLVPPGEHTVAQALGSMIPDPATLLEGTQVGSFRLRRLIASGGMGAVYEAVQDVPCRTVALKMIRPELASPALLQRFAHEVDLLARLQHPGIAQVYEAGVARVGGGAGEMPWFAMEFLTQARSITDYAREERLSDRKKIDLYLEVCAAVQHGHERGVIHRDLKPANILVDGEGRPKLIDFGVARATAPDQATLDGLTREGELVGTLLYMSPEQLTKGSAEVDVRTDVYALGIVLFELMTGAHPFPAQGHSISEIYEGFKDREPMRLSELNPKLPGDLDWIVRKALATDREERYASPRDLASDLERMLADEPVLAGPPDARYRLNKFFHRHRVAVIVAGMILASLLLGLVGTTLGLLRAQEAEQLAAEERQVAIEERNRAVAAMDFIVEVFSRANPAKGAREMLVVDSLNQVAQIFRQRFASQPDVRAMVARMLGKTYRGLGMTKESEEHLKEALELYQLQYGTTNVETAKVMADLLVLRREQGQLEAAEKLLHQALPILTSQLGEHAPETLDVRLQQSDFLRLRGKPKESENLLRAVVSDMGTALGTKARRTLLAKNQMAGLLHRKGRFDEAERLYRDAMNGLAECMGPDHPDTLSARSNLAMLFFSRGNRAKALEMMRKLWPVTLRVFGPKHRYTMRTRSTLGGMLHMEGHLDEAATFYYAALEASLELAPESRDVLVLRSNIARLEKDRGNLDKAEPMIREVWAIRSKNLGEAHRKTLISHNEMADLELGRGHNDKAAKLYERGLALASKAFPPEDPMVYRFLYGSGRVHIALQKYEEAEGFLLRCSKIFDTASGRSAVRGKLQPPRLLLVSLYEAWGRPEKAAMYRQ